MITPKGLAETIIDALTDAGIVAANTSVFDTAVAIAEEEIVARIAVGDVHFDPVV